MQGILRYTIVMFLLGTPWFILTIGYAGQHAQLQQLNNKIAIIKAVLSKDRYKRSYYLQKLKSTEISSGRIMLQLQRTTRHLKQQRSLLKKLNRNKNAYQLKLAKQRDWLAHQIRDAYSLGREPYLKFILNQTDANRISRLLIYYRYMSQNRLSIIHELQQTLSQLQSNQIQIQSQTKILTKLQHQQHHESSRLENIKQNRQSAITNLNKEIHTKNQRLAELLANKHLLEQTISRLERSERVRAAMKHDFAKLKGNLAWPTKGKILPYFGTKIYQSRLKWDGILIKAPANQPVYAVADGKVVFAKWLPGYGLLLIISHGHGYMTLYGRNHNLYKKPGDVVQKGDLIATVGQSGGYEKSALYFAIRHNAKPLNPLIWCHK